ncbi:hypothetical protein DICPUDRAFT_75595 [Dictyostelium purpureum]|uniref:Chitinase domain-containing protein 1 n=1 Tax=Dictyostelium purpureum TaxID=5786 RepID=F0ZB42_DICPU|nr:uncharacterized protein DICPUDRAFT_75595 [Dictyostelium purpureum]EGC38828.1 hypothetical protein DICPUDRAFT_75595 [Dictyostelium purpureum]|eukprot:XP_003284622.1 hypothetical protein DICPUDRAFT_75595 [Dictyostelium purpureum]
MEKNKYLIILLFLIVSLIISPIVSDEDDGEELEQTKDLFKRNLIREHVTPNQILSNYNTFYQNKDKRFFKGNVLAYITPWNGKGYEVSAKWTNKFTHLSPVWYQIKFENSNYLIEGDHNIKKDWMETIRENSNKKTKIVPRFALDGDQWSKSNNLGKTLSDSSFINSLLKVVKDNNFDGLVLEGFSHITREPRDQFFIKLSQAFHKNNKEIFIVISPIRQKGHDSGFNRKDFDKLSKYVDGFSLMTYDFAPQSTLNSPLVWCKENLEEFLGTNPDSVDKEKSKKLYLGLPFYGYKVENGKMDAVVGSQFIDILKENKKRKFRWVENANEHQFTFKVNGFDVTLTYPTLLFLQQRLELSSKYGASISIWEIGQGLDYFVDLL